MISCPFVRPSVTLVDCDEMHWNFSKIISLLISLTILFSADPSITFCSIVLSRCFHSRIFHPCKIVPIFPLLHFLPLQNRADVSTPAFSTPAFSTVPIFPLPHFQSPPSAIGIPLNLNIEKAFPAGTNRLKCITESMRQVIQVAYIYSQTINRIH